MFARGRQKRDRDRESRASFNTFILSQNIPPSTLASYELILISDRVRVRVNEERELLE